MLIVLHKFEADENSDIHSLFQKCKRLARAAKAQALIHQPIQSDFWNYIPSRQTSDQLVQAYLRSFESVYRVVHIPSFLREYNHYWTNPREVSPAFVIKLLLLMAIGAVFCQNQNEAAVLRSSSAQWIYTAQSWLSSPFEKSRLDVVGLQVHCLLLLARQTNAVSADLVWISAGSLLRTAMHMGFHIDPRHIPSMSSFSAELRRRLWATILEIVVQSGMDSGGLPLIDDQDFDCEAPSNIDDVQMEDAIFEVKPAEQFTQTSLQIALLRSLPIRLKIAKCANDFRRDVLYDETLRLSAELTAIYRENSFLFHSFRRSGGHPTLFQTKLFDLMTQRFLLALHDPFTIKAKSNPTFYYSRKVCLETSLLISNPPQSSNESPPDEDYARLRLVGAAHFRDVPMQAVSTICEELVNQLEEEQASLTPMSTSYSVSRKDLRNAVEEYLKLTMARIKAGETNVKGYLMFSCLLAQVDAMQSGASVDAAIANTLRKSLETCYRILKARAGESPPAHTDSGIGSSNSGQPADLVGPDSEHNWFLREDLVSGKCVMIFEETC
jgi:hypothetical protein